MTIKDFKKWIKDNKDVVEMYKLKKLLAFFPIDTEVEKHFVCATFAGKEKALIILEKEEEGESLTLNSLIKCFKYYEDDTKIVLKILGENKECLLNSIEINEQLENTPINFLCN